MTRGDGALRVAYDAGPLINIRTGVGRYAEELAAALRALGVDLALYAVAAGGPAAGGAIRRWRVPARMMQAAWRHAGRPRITTLAGRADVVHATNFVLPALGDVPGVVTVHDLSFRRGDTFPGGRRLLDLVPWSVRRAAAVLVPTEAIKEELCGTYDVAPERVRVTYEGVAPVFFGAAPLAAGALAAMGIRAPFVVAVGTIEPRKNLPRLLAAWREARRGFEEWTLVIAGPRGWGPALPETPGVALVGWIGDETLPGLLAAAELFCYPSLYEGFGLPPLEAMAAGTAALVGAYSAAREVVGEAALLMDPSDKDAMGACLRKALEDDALRADLARRGRAQAAQFTWMRAAKSTLAAYEVAVSK